MCGSRRGTGGQDPLPLIKHKSVGFLHNTGLDPQHRRPASKTPFPAFRWRADDGPFILVTELSRFIALTKLSTSAHGACFLIILNERTCRASECVECEKTHMSKTRTQS